MGVLFWVNPDQRVSGVGEWEGSCHSENQLQCYTLPFGLNVRNRQKSERSTPLAPPPMADYEILRAYRGTQQTLTIFQTLFQATRGVFRPGPDDPKTWYGRLFRFIGLLCVYAVIAAIVGVVIQDFIHGRR
jgi:hypothetical protein